MDVRCVGRSLVGLGMVLILGGGGSGCRQGQPDAGISTAYRLRVERVIGPQRRADGALVRDGVSSAVPGTRWFSQEDGPELPAEVRYARLAAADGSPLLRVELQVEPPAAERPHLASDMSAIVELSRVDGTIELQRDLPVALQRAVAVLDARVTLARGDTEARRALLGDEDPEIVLLALDWVADHRARDLADDVAELSDHADDRVALEAVECIGLVGGPQHARRLVVRPRVGDAAHANRLYETLANLGGDHAAGFLEFAARNEDDPDLARLAERSLARLRARPAPEDGADPVPARGHRGGEDT